MKINIQGSDYNVDILSMVGNNAQVKVNGEVYDVKIDGSFTSQMVQTPQPTSTPQAPVTPTPVVESKPVAQAPVNVGQGNYKFSSPLPGIILSIDVNIGDKISLGQNLIVLEAMKMENNITSDAEGVVTAIKVAKGDAVMEGDVLLEMATL